MRVCFLHLCTPRLFSTQEIVKSNISVVCRLEEFLANKRIIPPRILCLHVERSYALGYCRWTFQGPSSFEFPVLAEWVLVHVWLLCCILNSHLAKLVLIFPVARSLVPCLDMGNGVRQVGPLLSIWVFISGLRTSVGLPKPYLNAAQRDQVLCCYHWATPVVFQETWLSFVGP